MPTETAQDKIYNRAFGYLGSDPTPGNEIPNEVACVHSLSTIISLALGPEIRFPVMSSTIELFEYLAKSPSWKTVPLPQYGDIILSVTKSESNRGHCGIVGKRNAEDMTAWIMNNDSRSGKWEASYSVGSWQRYFGSKKGLSTLFFRCV